MKPTDKIKPEIKPEPEQFDNNTPRTKEEWFKSKWKMEKSTRNINGHGITFCIFFLGEKNFKRSNPFKRQIPIYIIYVMLRLANIGACYFVIQSILVKIAFSFFFWTLTFSNFLKRVVFG